MIAFSSAAVRVRRGDLVSVRGTWLEVQDTRLERYATGGPAVILSFPSTPALRIGAGERLAVRREAPAPQWRLAPDPRSRVPAYVAQCAVCGEYSEAAEARTAPETWCLHHAARTGHTQYRATVTTAFRTML